MPTLNWIGKDAVINHHKEAPFRLLKCRADLSVGDPDSGNLLVQGDNLEALKALLPYYAGQVKCIYIDPPYNTGNESWVYNDNVNSSEMREWLGKVVGGEAEDLSRHDKWLSMMYPRFSLLKELLRDDGAIFVSIDDNEISHLRLMMDEIFGAQNFIAQVIWQKVYSPRMDAKGFSADHDYIVVYGKPEFKPGKFSFEQNAGQFNFVDSKTNQKYRRRSLRKEGKNSRRIDRPNLFYALSAPDGSEVYPIRPDGSEGNWRWSLKRYKENESLVEWIKTDNGWQAYVKQYYEKEATRPPSTLWFHTEVGHNHEANEELKRMFGELVFDSPKPPRLIKRILELCTNPDEDQLILDSFGGSGTTGQAVLEKNSEDEGNRRFILVEMDKKISEQITAKRLTKAISGYKYKDTKGTQKEQEGLGGGFRFCELGVTLFDPNRQIREEVKYNDLAQHVYFVETGQPLPIPPPFPNPSTSLRASGKGAKPSFPLLGVHNGVAVYLLYNGILKDKSVNGGNVLTYDVLEGLPPPSVPPFSGENGGKGQKVIYGNGSRISKARLNDLGIVFKQIPYEIREM